MKLTKIAVYFDRMLATYSVQRRAKIWCDLNRYIWPEEFDQCKPDCWDSMDRMDKNKLPIFMTLWKVVKAVTPHKDCLRAWNAEMSEPEFEAFWKEITEQDTDTNK